MTKPFWLLPVTFALFCSIGQSQTMIQVSTGPRAFSYNYQNLLINADQKCIHPYLDVNGIRKDSLTFTRNISQSDAGDIFFRHRFFLGPSYFHFNDKDFHLSMWGGKLDYTYKLKEKFGLTFDLGLYVGSRPEGDSLQGANVNSHLWTIGGGFSYYPTLASSKLNLNMHLLAGVAIYGSKADMGYGAISTNKTSFCGNLGASLEYQFNKKWGARIVEADYMPTFFSSSMQNNYRLSTGIILRW